MNIRDFLTAALTTAFYFTVRKAFPDNLFEEYDVGVSRGKNYEKAVIEAVKLVG